MRIGVIHAASVRDKNAVLFDCVRRAAPRDEVINLGVFADEKSGISYVETALSACFLLESRAVDFVVTGCSSGQGMMLALGGLPGVCCGYLPTPSDAYLFGRINGGNAASLPLGLGYGWAGEINLAATLRALFDGEFGCGYPPSDAERKRADTARLKAMSAAARRSLAETLPLLGRELIRAATERAAVCDCLREHGDAAVVKLIESYL